ncbi:MAG: hypothetical protein WBA76_17295 [Phormidesmis sp.]
MSSKVDALTGDRTASPKISIKPNSKTIETIAETIEAVQSATEESLIIVDFDETLFLRNSTEEYLNSIYPRFLGALFLRGLKALKPWRYLPSQFRSESISRDWLLVLLATLVFPWTLLLWRWRAKTLAKAHWNWPLVRSLGQSPSPQIVVATLGFAPIVNPLLKHLPRALNQPRLQQADQQSNLKGDSKPRVIACRFWQGAQDRAKGKYAMLGAALGGAVVARAIAITDSSQDAPLLAHVKTPCWVVWPEAQYMPAMADVYLPLFYAEKVKHPNKAHFLRFVLLWHWLFLTMALSLLSPHPGVNAASLLLLVLSYWCIYEIGYWENDLIAEARGQTSVLSERYLRYKTRLKLSQSAPEFAPWCWAIALALPALLLLEVSKRSMPLALAFADVMGQWAQLLLSDSAVWLAFLGVVRLAFWLYNQFDGEARVWIYPLLQAQKLFGFTLLLGINSVGAALMMALIVYRWLQYTSDPASSAMSPITAASSERAS